MHRIDEHQPLQHPSVHAALSARNAVAAEMAVAGRARHHPEDPIWDRASHDARASDNACWVLASEAYARMQWDLACADLACSEAAEATAGRPRLPDPALQRAAALASLAVPVGRAAVSAPPLAGARATHRRPAARRRREYLEMAFWFVVGGLGGLLALMAIRGTEVVLAWR